jgi:hypothetical protein
LFGVVANYPILPKNSKDFIPNKPAVKSVRKQHKHNTKISDMSLDSDDGEFSDKSI